ncbi:MAG TPA: glycosyltransferase [Thermoplasmata archaeon]|nr:glycosyltransferase [Thermoplasmata archaeon]
MFDGTGVDAVVILPTLNEEEGLARTYPTIPFESLARAGHQVRAVVIDGGSSDSTLEVARRLGVHVLNQRTRGKGSAVREALEWVAEQGVRYALVMDADCTYPAEMIGPTLDLLKSGGELIVGVRNPVQTKPFGPRDIVHRFGNTLLNYLATQATGHTILDLCSGFYGIDLSTRVFDGLYGTGFEIEAELFLKAYRQGLTVLQIPIAYRERVGVAKLRAVRDGGRILVTILRSRRVRSVDPIPIAPGPGEFVRETLSACFVHGSAELVVVSHASRTSEAYQLVERLRGSRFQHTIVVPEDSSYSADPSGASPPPEARQWPSAAILHLGASSGPADAPAPKAVMYLPNTRRTIRLQLDSPLDVAPAPAESPALDATYARSAGRRTPSRTGRFVGSVATLGSVLDSSGFGKEMALLGANGLTGTVIAPELALPSSGPDAPGVPVDQELEVPSP